MEVNRAVISPGYFDVLRFPVLAGRDFTEMDGAKTKPVLIVNQTFARRYFHSDNAIGRRVRLFGKWTTVVGLAQDSKIQSG